MPATSTTPSHICQTGSLTSAAEGRWAHNDSSYFIVLAYSDPLYKRLSLCSRQEDFTRATASLLWQWKPSTCRFFDFRPLVNPQDSIDALLQKLGKAKIALVGDSIVLEQYLSLEVRSCIPLPASQIVADLRPNTYIILLRTCSSCAGSFW